MILAVWMLGVSGVLGNTVYVQVPRQNRPELVVTLPPPGQSVLNWYVVHQVDARSDDLVFQVREENAQGLIALTCARNRTNIPEDVSTMRQRIMDHDRSHWRVAQPEAGVPKAQAIHYAQNSPGRRIESMSDTLLTVVRIETIQRTAQKSVSVAPREYTGEIQQWYKNGPKTVTLRPVGPTEQVVNVMVVEEWQHKFQVIFTGDKVASVNALPPTLVSSREVTR